MDLIEKNVYLSSLYDIYKELLTEKQREYFEEYYFMDQSLSEVSLEFNVSRNAVFDQIKKIAKILGDYEEKLHLYEKKQKLEEILKKYETTECVDLINEIRNME